jgi:hypothetical protein
MAAPVWGIIIEISCSTVSTATHEWDESEELLEDIRQKRDAAKPQLFVNLTPDQFDFGYVTADAGIGVRAQFSAERRPVFFTILKRTDNQIVTATRNQRGRLVDQRIKFLLTVMLALVGRGGRLRLRFDQPAQQVFDKSSSSDALFVAHLIVGQRQIGLG